jgi:dTDP-4-dehydrorhamnose reductase
MDVHAVGRGGDGVDLADATALAAWLARARPEVVLHAAALSSIVGCERDAALALRVNAHAAATLCAHAARVVFVSTDLVFAGDRAPYAPGDAPRPLSVYGRTKARGEEAVLRTARGLVVRLPLLFGPSFDGRRGATDMIRAAAAEGRAVTLFTDEYRTPLHVDDAAQTLLDLAAGEQAGVMHLAGRERVSRSELGQRFVACAHVPGAQLLPAPGTDPLRPKDVSLRPSLPPARTLDAALAAS